MPAKLKKRSRAEKKSKPLGVLGELFDPASAKDQDFDLDLSAAHFHGGKGQAGNRTRAAV
jgi:hypothetical protein